MSSEKATPRGEDWTGLCASQLPTAEVSDWLVRDDCGASVVFTGTTRDRSEGRTGVSSLTYEAYESEVDRRLDAVVNEL
ncbi:MAG: molybdenum cofactor biosynthesis protein MoaE, partial [Microthrixaceae bacterium]|nr:molybdenum cofactor biosynthesis protein MoaE [Microthrixaceae bacterium]